MPHLLHQPKSARLPLLLGLALLIFALCPLDPALAAVEDYPPPHTVRVGFFAFDGYHVQDGDGIRSGYGYEVLQLISNYANLTYEYVGYDSSWAQIQARLEAGEIDLLTSAQKTPERLEKFDYSQREIGYSATIITTAAGDSSYLAGDYSHWDGLWVGLLEGNSRNASFDRFAREQGFSYEPVYFDSTDGLVEALKARAGIDVIVTSNLRSIQGEWILAEFDSAPFYVIVKKGNQELLDQLDYALEQLELHETDYRSRLRDKYYTADSGEEISFTPAERAYIADMEHTVFHAVLNPDRSPLSSFDAQGQAKGIVADIAGEIIRRSGLNIRIEPVSCRDGYSQCITAGQADVVFDAWANASLAEAMNYKLTPAYMTVSTARLYRDDFSGQVKTIALADAMEFGPAYLHRLDSDC